MLLIDHKIKTISSAQKIWSLWKNVEDWPSWDEDIDWCHLNDEFEFGKKGKLKPKSFPATDFILSEVTEYKSFTVTSKLPLAKIIAIHRIEENNAGCNIQHRMEIKGLLSVIFSKLMKKNMQHSVPKAMQKLVNIAEMNNHKK